jgi:hypothetical protein
MVEVTQEDREAAWPFRPSCYRDIPLTRAKWEAGVYDDAAPCIKAFARHREASVAAKDGEIALLQEIVRTQAEEAAKATYYYTDKMDELKKECDALAGALRAHEQHMGEAQHTCVRYLVPAADPIRIEKEQFVSEMLGHFDGPEQRAVQEKANAALAQYAAI